MKEKYYGIAIIWLVTTLLFTASGITIAAPKFEELGRMGENGRSGFSVFQQRLVPITGLQFNDVPAADPAQLFTSNVITVAGLGVGVVVSVVVNAGTTIIKNNVAESGAISTAKNHDTIALRVTSLGYGLTNTSTISVGSSSATWRVTTKPLGGTIKWLSGTGLVLQNNGTDKITIPAGNASFSFPAPVGIGSRYSVKLLEQPTSPLQTCTVLNGTGTVGAALSNISVVCATQQALDTY